VRIGYILTDFPVLSETFIRREAEALVSAGNRVFVYTNNHHGGSLASDPLDPGLVVRGVPFLRHPERLVKAARADGIEHLHGSLMSASHRATQMAAMSLHTLYTITAYSGHDIFTARERQLYRNISLDPLCAGIIVEDEFMRDWLATRLSVDARRIEIIPNSFDLDQYRLREPRRRHERVVILAIARLVEKKGLVHLVRAFNQVCSAREDLELWLVGDGPEEVNLRHAAGANSKIRFMASMPETETRQVYADADIFCLPCVEAASGDADGVPTTVLEAMAFELPIVSTNLLSMPFYVTEGQEGLLISPGDTTALASALERLCSDSKLREAMGRRGRLRVCELCDINRNVLRLQEVFLKGRRRTWQAMLGMLERQRDHYTVEREHYYTQCRISAIDYFKPHGRLLDIGCDHGKFRLHLGSHVEYFGCDVLINPQARGAFPLVAARAEALPYLDASFDAAVLYATLIHVFDVDAVLAEAARVLKPGGRLFLQECYNDPNPIHLNHFTEASLAGRIAEHLKIVSFRPANEYLMLMTAEKPAPASIAKPALLVSVAITAYNREEFIRRCIDSVLNQTYRPIEVVVVDDGSTDGTRRILEQYGSAIRVVLNEENRGRVVAKNRALIQTSPEASYVALLDSDDFFHPQFVAKCVDLLERQPETGLVYTDDIVIDASGRELRRQPSIEPWNIDVWLRTRNLRGDTWLARRDLVMNTRLHDEALELDEDYDLFYQLLESTSFSHLSEYLVYIRCNTEQTHHYRLNLAKCHAANLIKYGYSAEYAYLRARRNPEWVPAIEDGIALGKELRELRARRLPNNLANSLRDKS
jgi:glycosyltransferase involved in cell wall biosynthesis/ubiquinone/menaquinone biosynthesis C-methylase UbiE